ncbi:MAG: GDSL-type esterase/lipase family protein [Planctomycetota bacterium]|jgi:hypothetical protein
MHVVLLGDSILDNAAYTGGQPDVKTQLHSLIDGQARLLAVDGSVTHDVVGQVRDIPDDATHLVLSAGGNDALWHVEVPMAPARSTADALMSLMDVIDDFEQSYKRALASVFTVGLPTVACTIYNGSFVEPEEQRVVSAALRMFNDSIFQAAFDAGIPVIDLRRVCADPGDYANPIEPNSTGGLKIARAIRDVVEAGQWDRSWVWPSGGRR